MIANQRKSPLTFTVAYQKDPSLKQASTAIERQAYYYDIGYTISDKQTSVLFLKAAILVVGRHPSSMWHHLAVGIL